MEKKSPMNRIKFLNLFLISTILFCFFHLTCSKNSYTWTGRTLEIKNKLSKEIQPEKLFAGTPYETPMYTFFGEKTGPTVMIIGGTHGNEPAGYEAAYRLIELCKNGWVKSGKVLIIPEANIQAVKSYQRRIPVPDGVDIELGNLNRCYPGRLGGTPMEELAKIILDRARAEQVVAFLDLHESPVFHLETLKADEDGGLGQSIVYYPNDESSFLAMIAVDEVNQLIFGDPVTFSMLERPIQYSAAWAAGELLENVVAFTVETCKKLPIEERIQYQTKTVEIVLREKEMLE
jgi:hypothetical protein